MSDGYPTAWQAWAGLSTFFTANVFAIVVTGQIYDLAGADPSTSPLLEHSVPAIALVVAGMWSVGFLRRFSIFSGNRTTYSSEILRVGATLSWVALISLYVIGFFYTISGAAELTDAAFGAEYSAGQSSLFLWWLASFLGAPLSACYLLVRVNPSSLFAEDESGATEQTTTKEEVA